MWAMSTLGFDDYVNPLKAYLKKYRQAAKVEKAELISDKLKNTIVSLSISRISKLQKQVDDTDDRQQFHLRYTADDEQLALAVFIQGDESLTDYQRVWPQTTGSRPGTTT